MLEDPKQAERKVIVRLTANHAEEIELGIAALSKISTPSDGIRNTLLSMSNPGRFFSLPPTVRPALLQVFSVVLPEQLPPLFDNNLPKAQDTRLSPHALHALSIEAPTIAREYRYEYVTSGYLFAALMRQTDGCGATLRKALKDDGHAFLQTLDSHVGHPFSKGSLPILCQPTAGICNLLQVLKGWVPIVTTRDLALGLMGDSCGSDLKREVQICVESMGHDLETIRNIISNGCEE